MVEMLDLADHDVAFIADFIDYLIRKITPSSKPSSVHSSVGPRKQGDDSVVENRRDTGMEDAFSEDSSAILGEALQRLDCCVDDSFKNLSVNKTEMDLGELPCEERYKFRRNDSNLSECTHVNEMIKNNLEGLTSMEHGGMSGFMSLASSSSSSAGVKQEEEEEDDDDDDAELKAELIAIDSQYQQWFEELARMRDEALEAAKKKRMVKKKMVAPSV